MNAGGRERASTSGQRVPVVSNPRFLATADSFANCLHLASTVPGGIEVMLTEATEDYRKAE